MKFHLTYADAVARITEVIEAITASEEWDRYSRALPTSDRMKGREPFRRFFDVYEGQDNDE